MTKPRFESGISNGTMEFQGIGLIEFHRMAQIYMEIG